MWVRGHTGRFARVTPMHRHDHRFARSMRGMRSSVMRDLMAITARPEVISLAGGLPDTGAFDPEELRDLTDRISREHSAAALQYGPTEGLPAMRETVCRVMAAEQMHADPEQIIITTGGQQVLDLVARTFIDPGDIVIAEGPTYPGAVPVFSACQADVEQVPIDSDGLDPELVEARLDELERRGRRPKYLYTIPTFHNPAGTTCTLERRLRLVELARERDLLILEDNPYSMLRYEGDPVPTLRSLDTTGNVMYLGTFSKVFAPGVRLGWIAADSGVLSRINLVKQAADLCSSSMTQLVVSRFFNEHDWHGYIGRLIDVYRERRDAMVAALEQYFPKQATWTVPMGGLFLWVTLPEAIDTQDLLARALMANVAFVPGAGAWLDGRASSSMRLNFSAADADTITEGIRRLGEAINDVLILAERLGVVG